MPLSSGLAPEGEAKLLMSHSYLFFGLTWTRDGQQVLVVPGIGTKSGGLWKVAADGSGRREHMPFAGDEVANPSVSRQASRFAYVHGAVEDRNIWQLDLTVAGSATRSEKDLFVDSPRRQCAVLTGRDANRLPFEPLGP